MKRIAFAVYRNWAFKIFTTIEQETKDVSIVLLITTPEHEFSIPKNSRYKVAILEGADQGALKKLLVDEAIDTVCFYGWSWLVKEPVLSSYTCLCLHPSPLPKYRGGSPIQHQLVAGETESAVSLIKMSEGIDDGDIYTQIPINFTGYLSEILERIIAAGVEGTRSYIADLISHKVVFTPQTDLEKHSPLKRRTVADGEIFLSKVEEMSYISLYNLIRGLQRPYPHAYIRTDSGVLFIESVVFSPTLPEEYHVLTLEDQAILPDMKIALKVSDGFVLVTKLLFEKK